MKKTIKRLLYLSLELYELLLGNILYAAAKKYASMHTKLMHYKEWYFSDIEPSSYKHEINLYNWIYDTSQCEFVEGGALGRMLINKDDTVLDLCCGDGSYSYLFFSDITKHVDAIDYDEGSIKYAQKNYAKKNISYICGDLLMYDFQNQIYDVVIWRSGAAYFTKENRNKIFNKILVSLKSGGKFYISTPLLGNENFSANQIEVIIDEKSFEKEFEEMFKIKFKQKSFHHDKTNLNYILEKN